MTIEEKRYELKRYCESLKHCSECELMENGHCWTDASDKEIENNLNTICNVSPFLTRNIAEISDAFICGKCGICLEDCVSVEYDEDTEDTTYHVYEFKFCPECGRRVMEE